MSCLSRISSTANQTYQRVNPSPLSIFKQVVTKKKVILVAGMLGLTAAWIYRHYQASSSSKAHLESQRIQDKQELQKMLHGLESDSDTPIELNFSDLRVRQPVKTTSLMPVQNLALVRDKLLEFKNNNVLTVLQCIDLNFAISRGNFIESVQKENIPRKQRQDLINLYTAQMS